MDLDKLPAAAIKLPTLLVVFDVFVEFEVLAGQEFEGTVTTVHSSPAAGDTSHAIEVRLHVRSKHWYAHSELASLRFTYADIFPSSQLAARRLEENT